MRFACQPETFLPVPILVACVRLRWLAAPSPVIGQGFSDSICAGLARDRFQRVSGGYDEQRCDQQTLRSFGLIVGGILLVLALWPFLRLLLGIVFHKSYLRFFLGVVGLGMIYLAKANPDVLKKPYEWWMVIGEHLGWFNTRIIFGAIFFLIFTPLGFFMRLAGYDPLRLTDTGAFTYKIPAKPRDDQHMEKQF